MEAFDAAAFIFRPITVPLSMLSRVVDRVLPEEPAGAAADAPAPVPPVAARAAEPAASPIVEPTVAELAVPGADRSEGPDRG
jgi:hypothetical protein